MPVLGDDHVLEPHRKGVDEGHDRVSVLHSEGAPRHEIGLKVDRQQDVLIGNRDPRRHQGISTQRRKRRPAMALECDNNSIANMSGGIG
jgi:hypothetical protein